MVKDFCEHVGSINKYIVLRRNTIVYSIDLHFYTLDCFSVCMVGMLTTNSETDAHEAGA